MTELMATSRTGAPSTPYSSWESIDWVQVKSDVRRLQMRIAKAYREGRTGKANALQWLLTHSYHAKLLAVKRVSENRGARTPGVDKVCWNTSNQKLQAALKLKRRGYQTKPLKRLYIPKKQAGKYRPLSIPTMHCRGMQALHLLALEPIAECIADKNSYGFRPLRSTADAIEQCFNSLSHKNSAGYILEGDICACFDKISHRWILEHVPMDTEILRKWLTAGYMERGKLYRTTQGAPQGGIISPTILTVVLSGLEQEVKAVSKPQDKINVCVYADDFIITGATEEVLEEKVKPTVEQFLSRRGLTLSAEKTKLTHINEGFDFLSMNLRKYDNKLIIKPAKGSVKRFLMEIRELIKQNGTAKTENLIRLLNPKIRGWANYYAHVCSKRTFSYIDSQLFAALWRWAIRRHPNKSAKWIKDKYFHGVGLKNWVFSTKIRNKEGISKLLTLVSASEIPIVRHVKIRADATPYNPTYQDYLERRISKQRRKKARSFNLA